MLKQNLLHKWNNKHIWNLEEKKDKYKSKGIKGKLGIK